MGKSQRPTLKTIAEALGLGVTTVSRALSDADDISQSTKAKVRETADRLGYRRDLAGVRLRTGKTGSVSFVLHPHDELVGYGSSLMLGLSRGLEKTDYQLNVIPDFLHEDPIKPIEKLVRNRTSDGVIFSQTYAMDKRVRLLLEHGLPFVSHGRTELATEHPFYDFDNQRFAYEAVKRLAAKGCRKIILIAPHSEYLYHHHMKLGLTQASHEVGVESAIVDDLSLASDTADIMHWAKGLGEVSAAPDGIICSGEASALAVNAGLSARPLGATDIKLVSKQTSKILALTKPDLETCFEDIEQTGFRLAQMLLQNIEGSPVENLQEIQATCWTTAERAFTECITEE